MAAAPIKAAAMAAAAPASRSGSRGAGSAGAGPPRMAGMPDLVADQLRELLSCAPPPPPSRLHTAALATPLQQHWRLALAAAQPARRVQEVP